MREGIEELERHLIQNKETDCGIDNIILTICTTVFFVESSDKSMYNLFLYWWADNKSFKNVLHMKKRYYINLHKNFTINII